MSSATDFSLGLTTDECPIGQEQTSTLGPQYGTHLEVISRGKLITLDCFHHGRSNILFLLE